MSSSPYFQMNSPFIGERSYIQIEMRVQQVLLLTSATGQRLLPEKFNTREVIHGKQPRPQGLLAFQNGGGSGEDPGTQQITCLQRGWRCIQNGGYGEKGEKNWVRDAKVKINKNRKNRHVLDVRVLGIRKSVRGLVFAVHCSFFVI